MLSVAGTKHPKSTAELLKGEKMNCFNNSNVLKLVCALVAVAALYGCAGNT